MVSQDHEAGSVNVSSPKWDYKSDYERLLNGKWTVEEMQKRLATYKLKPCISGVYIGPVEQFKNRRADLSIQDGFVWAQFDEGELWETHSRLIFTLEDWKLDE